MPKITGNQNRIISALGKQLARFPWYDTTELNNALNTISPGGVITPAYPVGMTWEIEGPPDSGMGGFAFQYVKVQAGSANLAQGNIVKWADPTSGTVTAAGSTTSAIITNINTTTLGNLNGCIVNFNDTTTPILTQRRIFSATTGASATLTIAKSPDSLVGNQTAPLDALPSIPTNGSALSISFPNQCIIYPIAGNLNVPACGIALGTVTNGQYTIIQKKGFGEVTAAGNVTAIVAGAQINPGTVAAGVGVGAAAATALDPRAIGIAQIASAAAAQLIPVLLTSWMFE